MMMRTIAPFAILLLAIGCGPRRGTPSEKPGETPIAAESGVRIARFIQSKAAPVRLTSIRIDGDTEGSVYVEGRTSSTPEFAAFLTALSKDPHLAAIQCDWGLFEESGVNLFGLKSPLHTHRKVATIQELLRVPPPALSDLLVSMQAHDKEGRLSRLARLRELWTTRLYDEWTLVHYDFTADFPTRDVSLDVLLGLFEALEGHYPTLRVSQLDLRLKDGVPTRALARLKVYHPPALKK